ncbi:MAG: hypothetical protein R3B09_16670 [Nannocystaceae bacterium]
MPGAHDRRFAVDRRFALLLALAVDRRVALTLALALAPIAALEARADKVPEPAATSGAPTPLADRPPPITTPPAEPIDEPQELIAAPAAPTLPEPRAIPVQEIEPTTPASPPRGPADPSAAGALASADDEAPTYTLSLRIPIVLVIAGVAALLALVVRALRRRRRGADG